MRLAVALFWAVLSAAGLFCFWTACSAAAAPGAPQAAKALVISAASGLRLRESATTEAKVVTTLPLGTRVQVLESREPAVIIDGRSGHWVRVAAFGKTGWVFGGYLREVDAFVFGTHDVVARLRALTGMAIPDLRFRPRGERADPSFTRVVASKETAKHRAFSISLTGDNKKGRHCSGYGHSECVSLVGTTDGALLFSDVATESAGELDHLDGELAVFRIGQGEGDGCSADGESKSVIFEFAARRAVRTVVSRSGECPPEHMRTSGPECTCAVELVWKETVKVMDMGGRIIRPSPAVQRFLKRKSQDR